jgi:zinc/manganese transport system ATP-binding protein
MNHAALRLDSVTLRHGATEAVAGLTGTFAAGSLTAVVGPNGAGKTTLLRALAGLHKPQAGSIDRGGLLPTDIALLPQASRPDRHFPLTCLDVAAQGLFPRLGAFRAASAAQRARVVAALVAVGLDGAGDRPIGALSAGQFQRLLFARLLLQDAKVLLLDEPFNAVDAPTTAALLALLRQWHRDGRTVIAVLHDLEMVRRLFPGTLLLAREAIAWGPTQAVLTPANRRRARFGVDDWTLIDNPELEQSGELERPAA